MNFLILSDSHGHSDRIQAVLDRPSVRPDAILFAGDGLRDFSYLSLPCPLFSVTGNNDFMLSYTGSDSPKADLTLDMEGCRIFMTHGHQLGVKSGTERLLMHAVARQANVVIYGHTHSRYQEYVPAGTRVGSTVLQSPVWLFNPGSIGDREASFGTLELRGGQPLFGFGSL